MNCNEIFEASWDNIRSGTGCPHCKESNGEKKISYVLNKLNINFKIQYRIKDCKNIRPLPFDFAVLDYNNNLKVLIEYDGELHYTTHRFARNYKKALEKLEYTQNNDKIKNEYCKNNNIKLIRIPYWEFDNIESILQNELKDLIHI